MKEILQGFIVAFSMYSKIPMPQINWTKGNMKYCICYFPLIGLVIGGLMSLWLRVGTACGWGTIFVTSVLILIPVLVSGGIHLDGLLDTADALSSYKSREEKLEILKDSHAGAFAIIVCVCYFILDFGVFSEMTREKLYVVAFSFVLSRALSGLALVTFPKAKNSGLLRTFADSAANKKVAMVMVGYLIIFTAVMIFISPLRGTAAAAAAFLVWGWYYRMSMRKFGGITGDLAGCFVQIAELAMALTVMLCP